MQLPRKVRRDQKAWGILEPKFCDFPSCFLLPVVATVTLKGTGLAVAKAHVVSEGGRQWAGHVTQRALVVVH